MQIVVVTVTHMVTVTNVVTVTHVVTVSRELVTTTHSTAFTHNQIGRPIALCSFNSKSEKVLLLTFKYAQTFWFSHLSTHKRSDFNTQIRCSQHKDTHKRSDFNIRVSEV